MNVAQNAVTESERSLPRGSVQEQRADAFLFVGMLLFIWAGLLFGFVPRIYQHIVQHRPPYLAVVHLHTFLFLGWMILFTTQVVLVRSTNLPLHRRLGKLSFFWGPAMVLIGMVTQFMVSQARFGTPRWDPPFVAIPLADLVNFGVLLAFALQVRRNGATHKRLMLLATSAISNVGFARWWGDSLENWLGVGFLSEMTQDYLGGFLVIVGLIGYDVAVQGRPSRPVLIGGAFIIGVEALAIFLYFNPWWLELTTRALHP